MSGFCWPDTTPTVISQGGTTLYIYPSPEVKAALPKDWVKRADELGGPIRVVTREAVPLMLAKVDAKAITAARLDAETLDIKDEGDAATPISVVDWEACVKLAEAVAVAAPIEEAADGR